LSPREQICCYRWWIRGLPRNVSPDARRPRSHEVAVTDAALPWPVRSHTREVHRTLRPVWAEFKVPDHFVGGRRLPNHPNRAIIKRLDRPTCAHRSPRRQRHDPTQIHEHSRDHRGRAAPAAGRVTRQRPRRRSKVVSRWGALGSRAGRCCGHPGPGSSAGPGDGHPGPGTGPYYPGELQGGAGRQGPPLRSGPTPCTGESASVMWPARLACRDWWMSWSGAGPTGTRWSGLVSRSTCWPAPPSPPTLCWGIRQW
jgi:hypothetical protein